MKKEKRFFVRTITEAATQLGIKVEWGFGDWICRLEKNGKHQFIYGYNFPINSAISFEIAKDKTATSYFLNQKKIEAVEHEIFMKPELTDFLEKDQSVEAILKRANQWGYPIVCKDNRGTGGNNVFKVENDSELKQALSDIWSVSRAAALSPFYDIENEYRFFILDTKIQFGYKKIKSEDEWKFNLNRGGEAEVINIDDFPDITKNILDAVHELNLRVCSVDVIKLKNENKFLILEVNTGICTEYFSQTSQEAQKLSQDLYSNILKKMFEE